MSRIKTEVVTLEDFEGNEGDARELVQNFVRQSENEIELKRTLVLDEQGDVIREEIQGKTRHSEIPWDSIAVLVMSNPQTMLDFLKWAANYPGLTIGFSTVDGTWLKVFSDNALVKIEGSLNIDLTVIGSYSENKKVV